MDVAVVQSFFRVIRKYNFLYFSFDVVLSIVVVDLFDIVFFDKFQLINYGDDFREQVGSYFSQIVNIFQIDFGPIEIGAFVLVGCFCFDELQEHKTMISVSETGQFAFVVEFFRKVIPLIIVHYGLCDSDLLDGFVDEGGYIFFAEICLAVKEVFDLLNLKICHR